MFYKFMGGSDEALLEVFDKAVSGGSLKFGGVAAFNDPFEFKFASVPPTREAFDAWHAAQDHGKTPEQIEWAWESFSGPGADWTTGLEPRLNMLSHAYVLCLARRWDSHLMWSHYTNAHRGFAIVYKPDLERELAALQGFLGQGDVTYGASVPKLHWFDPATPEPIGTVIGAKLDVWSYEEEYRVALVGDPGQTALFRRIDPALIEGVILGARASRELVTRAKELRAARAGFSVRQVSSLAESYDLRAPEVTEAIRMFGDIL